MEASLLPGVALTLRLPKVAAEEEEGDVGSWSLKRMIARGNARERQQIKRKQLAQQRLKAELAAKQEAAMGAGAGGASTSAGGHGGAAAAALALLPGGASADRGAGGGASGSGAGPVRSYVPQVQIVNGQIVVDPGSLTVQAQQQDQLEDYR